MLFLSYIIYLSTFGAGKKSDKFYKNIIELYPDINLDSPKHKGIEKMVIPKSIRKIC